MALGANAGRVVSLVLREGAALTVVGVLAGTAASLAVTRYLETLLFEVGPRDAMTFAAVAVMIGAVANRRDRHPLDPGRPRRSHADVTSGLDLSSSAPLRLCALCASAALVLCFLCVLGYNRRSCPTRGEVAQLVEHTTENRSVDSSILSLATTNPFPFTDFASALSGLRRRFSHLSPQLSLSSA